MRHSVPTVLLAFASSSLAFPTAVFEAAHGTKSAHGKRQSILPIVDPPFDAEAQHIDVSGQHQFVAPNLAGGDQRGPCPGLNALANHGYLPHNGVATISQFIQATTSVFGMGDDIATFLAIYGSVMDGDLKSWSIGGPTNAVSLGNLLSRPQGISFSHNKYETDGSPTRGDMYQYGNAFKLVMSQWEELYNTQAGVPDDQVNYDLSVLTPFRASRVAQSKANNPYYFSGPFPGVVVQPAAYTFIYRFMANKSAEYPEGRLDRDVLKSFFSIQGDETGGFTHTPGNERIPENWYRRAFGDEYTIPYFQTDFAAAALAYPEFLRIGGNTGTVNSFAGVDPSDLTGGVYNSQNLLEGNNAACFAFQAAVQQAPDFLQGLLGDLTGAVSQLTGALNTALGGLNCPQLRSFDTSALKKFPGLSKMKSDGTY